LTSLTYIRSKLLTFSTPTQFPKRIFLSRRKASERRPFNETDVSNLFKTYGFITVFPEDYSIAEQISMFNNADFIAGGTGGAFTNLLFCKAGCNVFCFTNYALDLSIFSTVAKHVNAHLLYIADESKDISTIKNIHESFRIDLHRLDDIVRHWIT
jgi:capsular polysaccharide biosynthesis protein